MARALRTVTLLAAIAALTACGLKETSTPELSGPSELGLSLALTASPDTLSRDGSSKSTITIQARDANSRAVSNLTCRVDLSVDGTLVDFGTLSNRTVTTGSDGKAVVTYTAPPASLASTVSTIVVVNVTPVSTDYANSLTRSVSLNVVPLGVIDGGTAPAYFAFSPEAPTELESTTFTVTFCSDSVTSACTPTTATSFTWSFGDGGRAAGSTVVHQFSSAGTYYVTLTVTDKNGLASSSTLPCVVAAGAAPVASFTITPESPTVALEAVLNAAASTVAAGRTIVSYKWDFGDGVTKTRTTPTTTHDWMTVGTFPVTLTITDSAGNTAVAVKSVTVKAAS